jgi:hypothetical protein
VLFRTPGRITPLDRIAALSQLFLESAENLVPDFQCIEINRIQGRTPLCELTS